MEIVVVNKEYSDPFEYWCYGCKKLYLSYVKTEVCNHCGHNSILKGKLGELNKEALQNA